MKLLTEPCRPYNNWPGPEPADIWAIIDRLTHQELRTLVMSYAIRVPAPFEQKLLEVWNKRGENL